MFFQGVLVSGWYSSYSMKSIEVQSLIMVDMVPLIIVKTVCVFISCSNCELRILHPGKASNPSIVLVKTLTTGPSIDEC